MCKVSGKTNLTYEEALLSEEHATEKIHLFPKELMAPALQIIQYSMLSLKDLADMIAAKLNERLYVGAELYARKDGGTYSCKISKVLEDNVRTIKYEVAWLDRNKKVTGTSIPWNLSSVPQNLRSKVFFKDGLLVCKKKRTLRRKQKMEKCKRKKFDGSERDQPVEETIKYPIDDLLVQPDANDPVFTDRPSPSRDFNVPMECVGDLLMVWDFVSSFGRLLHLWPFSLEDFEKAICHKKGNLILLVETHAALLRLLIKDNGEYVLAVQKRRPKITLITWTDYLCDFLEMRQALGASRREEALEEARKKREEKERLKAESDVNRVVDLKTVRCASENGNHIRQNGDIVKKRNGEIQSYREDRVSDKSESKQLDTVSKQNVEGKAPINNVKDLSDKESIKLSRDDGKEVRGRSSKERREYYEREMEKRFVRTDSLGKDRFYNRYWWFQRDGRVFVESSDSKQWGYYSSKEELNLLMESLNCKGERERELKKQLEKFNSKMSLALEKRSKELAQKIAMEDESVVRRSTRVRAPPSKNPANAFLEYVNKWKEE
ncbi:hypothetical protein M0R45_005760 [Rubus argutus]|uniref:DDT domain-containing protein n=1 Tax=Rubus argutus TaxID=59490 RepID=A0AAW1YNM2_RUBAR